MRLYVTRMLALLLCSLTLTAQGCEDPVEVGYTQLFNLFGYQWDPNLLPDYKTPGPNHLLAVYRVDSMVNPSPEGFTFDLGKVSTNGTGSPNAMNSPADFLRTMAPQTPVGAQSAIQNPGCFAVLFEGDPTDGQSQFARVPLYYKSGPGESVLMVQNTPGPVPFKNYIITPENLPPEYDTCVRRARVFRFVDMVEQWERATQQDTSVRRRR